MLWQFRQRGWVRTCWMRSQAARPAASSPAMSCWAPPESGGHTNASSSNIAASRPAPRLPRVILRAAVSLSPWCRAAPSPQSRRLQANAIPSPILHRWLPLKRRVSNNHAGNCANARCGCNFPYTQPLRVAYDPTHKVARSLWLSPALVSHLGDRSLIRMFMMDPIFLFLLVPIGGVFAVFVVAGLLSSPRP